MNLNTLLKFLPWFLPPFVGALIGYITNYVAIRMLFRPLTEKRIFGIRIPLTPGIIPKQRYELAESIGRMVSRELITVEAVQEQLVSEKFRDNLEDNIRSLLGNLADMPLSSIKEQSRQLLFSSAEHFLSETLFKFFSSRSFIYAVRSLLTNLINSLSDKRIEDIISMDKVRPFINEKIIPHIADSELRKKIAFSVEKWFLKQREGNTALSSFIPEELIDSFSEFVSAYLPELFDSLFIWLKEDSTNSELHIRGKKLLRDVLDKLNSFQKFLVSAAQYDRTLEERMPEIIDDVIKALESSAYDPKNLVKIKKVIRKSLSNWCSNGDLFLRTDKEISISELIENALKALDRDEIQGRIAISLENLITKNKDHTIREILSRIPGFHEQDVLEFTSFQVLNILSRKETTEAIASEIVSFALRFLEEHQEKTIGELLHIKESLREKISIYLTDKLISILNRRLPKLIQSFNIQDLVVTKINQLDVIDVEKLLLMVIARHLKWINLFGAILGALIGVSQIILGLIR